MEIELETLEKIINELRSYKSTIIEMHNAFYGGKSVEYTLKIMDLDSHIDTLVQCIADSLPANCKLR